MPKKQNNGWKVWKMGTFAIFTKENKLESESAIFALNGHESEKFLIPSSHWNFPIVKWYNGFFSSDSFISGKCMLLC